jgi:hypothetical protein
LELLSSAIHAVVKVAAYTLSAARRADIALLQIEECPPTVTYRDTMYMEYV